MPSLIEAKARVFDRDDRPGGPPVPKGLRRVSQTDVFIGVRPEDQDAQKALQQVTAGWGEKVDIGGYHELRTNGDPVALIADNGSSAVVLGRTPTNLKIHKKTIFSLINEALGK